MKLFQSFISFLPFRAGTNFRLLASSLLLLSSCVQESFVADHGDGAPVEILLNGGVGSLTASGSTRAVLDDDYFTKNDLPVSVFRIDQNADGTWRTEEGELIIQVLDATRVKGMGKTAINFATQQFYQVRSENNETEMVSIYPRVGTPGVTLENENVKVDLTTGAIDFMCTWELAGSKTNPFGTADDNQIIYRHALTHITVAVIAKDVASVTQWGTIQSITLMGVGAFGVYGVPGGYFYSEKTTDVTLRAPGSDGPMSRNFGLTYMGDPVVCGYALTSVPTKELELEIDTSLGGRRNIMVSPPAGADFWEDGKSYTIELTFSAGGIAPFATIGEWVDSHSVTGGVKV